MKRETARYPIRNGQALTETTDSSPHSSKSYASNKCERDPVSTVYYVTSFSRQIIIAYYMASRS